jgi:hypothetical protein
MHNILAMLDNSGGGINQMLKENTRYIDYILHDQAPLIIYDVALG